MDKPEAKQILNRLEIAYPNAHCELEYDSVFHLLVAVILSAQCTDARVNKVTRELYKTFSSPLDFAFANALTLEKLIFSCGFYHNKAANIIRAASDIVTRYAGEVPRDFTELMTLAGVGRKTANVIMAEAFGGDNIAVDTHVFRVSNRLALSSGKTPEQVERDLLDVILPQDRRRAHHLLIFHGRYCCHSRRPECDKCILKEFCSCF